MISENPHKLMISCLKSSVNPFLSGESFTSHVAVHVPSGVTSTLWGLVQYTRSMQTCLFRVKGVVSFETDMDLLLAKLRKCRLNAIGECCMFIRELLSFFGKRKRSSLSVLEPGPSLSQRESPVSAMDWQCQMCQVLVGNPYQHLLCDRLQSTTNDIAQLLAAVHQSPKASRC